VRRTPGFAATSRSDDTEASSTSIYMSPWDGSAIPSRSSPSLS